VEGMHDTTVNVSVYKKVDHKNDEGRNGEDIFLFTKAYTIPVYEVDEMN